MEDVWKQNCHLPGTLGAGLGRYLCAARAPFGPQVELRPGYSWVWTDCPPITLCLFGPFQSSPSTWLISVLWNHRRVSFPDIPGSHFRSAVQFSVQHQNRGKTWKLDRWPALLAKQETFSYPRLRGCSHLHNRRTPHFVICCSTLESHTSSWNCMLSVKGISFILPVDELPFKNF